MLGVFLQLISQVVIVLKKKKKKYLPIILLALYTAIVVLIIALPEPVFMSSEGRSELRIDRVQRFPYSVECASLDYEYHDECYYYAAKESLDPTFCASIGNKDPGKGFTKADCYIEIASPLVPELCEKISKGIYRDRCYQNIGTFNSNFCGKNFEVCENLNRTQFCDKIEDQHTATECYSTLNS